MATSVPVIVASSTFDVTTLVAMTTAGDRATATGWRPAGAGRGDDDDVVDDGGVDPHAGDLGAVEHERRVARLQRCRPG